jgi:hypothetical protein
MPFANSVFTVAMTTMMTMIFKEGSLKNVAEI